MTLCIYAIILKRTSLGINHSEPWTFASTAQETTLYNSDIVSHSRQQETSVHPSPVHLFTCFYMSVVCTCLYIQKKTFESPHFPKRSATYSSKCLEHTKTCPSIIGFAVLMRLASFTLPFTLAPVERPTFEPLRSNTKSSWIRPEGCSTSTLRRGPSCCTATSSATVPSKVVATAMAMAPVTACAAWQRSGTK